MNMSVIVSIKKEKGLIRVSNDKGKEWIFPFNDGVEVDTSDAAALALVANSMLTGTIASHLQHSDAKELTYKLTLITK